MPGVCEINQIQLLRQQVLIRYPEERQTAYDDIPIRLSISVSLKMSEMSSAGRDSKVDMAVRDMKMGIPIHHANRFMYLCPTVAGGRPDVPSFCSLPFESSSP